MYANKMTLLLMALFKSRCVYEAQSIQKLSFFNFWLFLSIWNMLLDYCLDYKFVLFTCTAIYILYLNWNFVPSAIYQHFDFHL